MEIFIMQVCVGATKLELSIIAGHGCRVVFSARDADDRRILKAPLLEGGDVKTYASVEEAYNDLHTKFNLKISGNS